MLEFELASPPSPRQLTLARRLVVVLSYDLALGLLLSLLLWPRSGAGFWLLTLHWLAPLLLGVGLTLLLSLALLALTSCASQRVARAPDGSAYTLEVFFDHNSGLRNAEQVNQVISFMEPDLREILQHSGYQVVQSSNPEAFVPGPNKFLLIIKVVNYNPGSKAARMMVGWGAGALVLDTQHLLYAGPGQLVFQGGGSVGSARDWEYAARKINQQVTKEVTNALMK